MERERRKKMEMKQRRESRGKRESLLGGVGVVVAMGMDGLAHLSEAEALSHGGDCEFFLLVKVLNYISIQCSKKK